MKKTLENQIKEQIENRRIKPSSDTWNRISEEINQSKHKKAPFWKWSVAASVIVFLGIGIFWFLNEHPKNINQNIADNVQKKSQNIQEINPENTETITSKKVAEKKKYQTSISNNSTIIESGKTENFIPNINQKTENSQIVIINSEEKNNKPPEENKTKTTLVETLPKTQQKPQQYINAEMLLYSVEYKDVIQGSWKKDVLGYIKNKLDKYEE